MLYRYFESLLEPFANTPNHQPPNTLLAFCRHFIRGVEKHLIAMAGFSAAIAIIEVVLFQFLGKLVDLLNQHTPSTLWQNASGELMVMSVVVLVGLPLCILFHSLIIHQTLLGNFPMAIRWQGHRYLLGQSYSFYQDEFAGRIATKLMQTALAVRETVLKLLDVFLFALVFFAGVTVVAGQMDWRLALPFVAWFCAYCVILRVFIPRLKKVSEKQADARSEMTGRIVDTYTNISTVKLFSHSQREEAYTRAGMESFLHTVYPQMRLATGFNVSVWCINALLIFSVCALAIYLWHQGTVTSGAIATAIAVVMRLYGMSQWIMWEVSTLFENIGTAADGMNTLSVPQKVTDHPQARTLEVTKGEIEFKQFDFHYGKGSGVIHDFNLTIRAGEKIGLVGRSGAGKSTLVNALLRFFDAEGGEIRIDGQNIAYVQQESLRSNIGVVTQDTSLLHRSVRDNILYGRPEATEAELQLATQQAKADQFIAQLADAKGRTGLDAHVGERGVKLSGGQRQRIAIARVLLKNAPILILDEATSALDSEVEAAIQDSLYTLMEGKTVIAIAHRLSTIAAMDRLIVLDQGQIVEQGTHQELLQTQGLYAQLWAHQSGGFV